MTNEFCIATCFIPYSFCWLMNSERTNVSANLKRLYTTLQLHSVSGGWRIIWYLFHPSRDESKRTKIMQWFKKNLTCNLFSASIRTIRAATRTHTHTRRIVMTSSWFAASDIRTSDRSWRSISAKPDSRIDCQAVHSAERRRSMKTGWQCHWGSRLRLRYRSVARFARVSLSRRRRFVSLPECTCCRRSYLPVDMTEYQHCNVT